VNSASELYTAIETGNYGTIERFTGEKKKAKIFNKRTESKFLNVARDLFSPEQGIEYGRLEVI